MILTNDHMSVNIYRGGGKCCFTNVMCECFVSLYIRDIINACQRIHTVSITFNIKVFNIGLYHDTYGAPLKSNITSEYL